ncbi:Iron-sulfur cluster assembly protein SufB [Methanosarcina lacustris Z-7289]|uniref:Iron-sulfur cluster assembly protein SufB n=1 Tax=Methanosarcina lacustris Z-7289 TaxID=1434111 RepID=A0A0E3S998_9EURY|nr:SufD family Fe-S cluster assembly protein [Methanosarcina lacustris]AKB75743.1 Iron-sulfur cluster assembly protein SufB [Methanosarcina lacustris Z-7289]
MTPITLNTLPRETGDITAAYTAAGGDAAVLHNHGISSLVISGNKVLSANATEGVVLEKNETEHGVDIKLTIKKGYKIPLPVHLCFGVVPKDGLQEINMNFVAEEDSAVELIAHCTFPNAEKVIHKMEAEMLIGKNASLKYTEIHFHGPYGGIQVFPKAHVTIEEGGSYYTNFSLISGRVGYLEFDYSVDAGKDSICEMITKVYGKADDKIKIFEKISLNGENARSVIKSRLAITDHAESVFRGITEGHAPRARGHVDCMEVLQGNAKAEAVPIVRVDNPLAKVTHEAAIGCVDKKEVETLMARGLEEDDAIDIIVKGMLA